MGTSASEMPGKESGALPTIRAAGPIDWHELWRQAAAPLCVALAGRLPARRWFGAKAKTISGVEAIDAIEVTPQTGLAIVRVNFTDGSWSLYQIPLAIVTGSRATELVSEAGERLWARVESDESSMTNRAVVDDGLRDEGLCAALWRLIARQASLAGKAGDVVACQPAGANIDAGAESPPARLVESEQSNSSIIFGSRTILKLFRRLDAGPNPDLEMTAYLTRRGFAHVPPLAGAIEYRPAKGEPWTLGILQGFVPNQGDAWQHLQTRLRKSFADVGPNAAPAIDVALPEIELLARRTADLHLALGGERDDPAFTPEPFSKDDQAMFRQRALALASEAFGSLERGLASLPATTLEAAERVLQLAAKAKECFEQFGAARLEVFKIRCHGDYHLGQVLYTGDDFVIIDFEGEPVRPLAERREKQLALRDVAGMIRSLHYASYAAADAVRQQAAPAEAQRIENCAASWYAANRAAFLRVYLAEIAQADPAATRFLPRDGQSLRLLLDACLVEKAIYELRYELNHRPDWVYLPLKALAHLLGDARA